MLLSLVVVVLLSVHACLSQRHPRATQPDAAAQPHANLTCVPYGLCEPCPEEALHQPYCQPFGNRRLMHCRKPEPPPEAAARDSPPPPPAPSGEILAWESCGRVVFTERADFFEFIAVNLIFSCVGIGLVVWRSRRMQALHARQLAARIGLPGRRQ